jgi:hypothetical protein
LLGSVYLLQRTWWAIVYPYKVLGRFNGKRKAMRAVEKVLEEVS